MDIDTAMDEETMVTTSEARREVEAHGLDWSDFLADNDASRCRFCSEWPSRLVLEWLGY